MAVAYDHGQSVAYDTLTVFFVYTKSTYTKEYDWDF